MAQIKPCPFCGGKAIIREDLDWQYSDGNVAPKRVYVCCENYCCRTMGYLLPNEQEMIDRWNKRDESQQNSTDVEKIKELKDGLNDYISSIRSELERVEDRLSNAKWTINDTKSTMSDVSDDLDYVEGRFEDVTTAVSEMEDSINETMKEVG